MSIPVQAQENQNNFRVIVLVNGVGELAKSIGWCMRFMMQRLLYSSGQRLDITMINKLHFSLLYIKNIVTLHTEVSEGSDKGSSLFLIK